MVGILYKEKTMAQDVQEITEILNQIKDDADKNSQSFEKLLTAINNRLEFMANDTESDDLIKVYLNELKKTLEDRQIYVSEEFQKISAAFTKLYEEQEKLPTTENMQNILSSFSANMLVFSREIQEQKQTFSEYLKAFDAYTNDKQDKADIISSVSEIKHDVEVINSGFEASISEINANIQSIFKNLIVMDPSAQNDIVKRELENVYIATNSILTALHTVEQKNDDLLANLYNFSTKDDIKVLEEKFEVSSARLDNDFVLKADAILSKIEPLAEKSDIDNVLFQTGQISGKFEDLVKQNDLNEIKSKTADLEGKIEQLPQQADIAGLYASVNEFSKILDTLKTSLTDSNNSVNSTVKEHLDRLNTNLAKVVTDADFAGFRHDLADFIQKIIDNSSSLNSNLNVNKETLLELIGKVETLDVHKDMEEITRALNDIKQTASTNLRTIVEEVNNMSDKIDFEPIMSNFGSLNETISSNSEEIKNLQNEILNKLSKEGDTENFRNINNNIDLLRETISASQTSNESANSEKLLAIRDMILTGISSRDEKFSGLHEKLEKLLPGIDFAKESILSATETSGKELAEKLVALRDFITEGLTSRDENFAQIKNKINDFVENYTNIANNTEAKVGNTISEIAGLKTEVENITKGIAEWNYNQDDRDAKLAGVISSELGEISSTLGTLQDGIQAGLHQEITKNSELVETQINNLLEYIENVKTELTSKDDTYDFSAEFKEVKDKITSIKQEINLVNTDIADVFSSKAEAIIMEIAKLKNSVDSIEDLKTGISNEFEELRNVCDVEALRTAIEDVHSFISKKFEVITDLINVKDTLSGTAEDIKTTITEKINSNSEELKTALSVALNNDTVNMAIEDLKSDLSDKLSKVYNETTKNSEIVNSAQKIIDKNTKDLEIITDGNTKISGLLDIINQKIDVLAMANDGEDYSVLDEIDEVKNLISSQRNLIENTANSDKVSAIEDKLEDLVSKIDNIETTDLKDMRETILTAILSVFEQISFIEESEDIKDFVEEKTDEINESIRKVQQQLKQIVNVDDDYAYTLQDVESDIAKLRMVLNDLSNTSSQEEISDISNNIHKIVSTVEELQSSLTQEQMSGLKADFERLSEDVLSISSRTNKLLLTSDESYNALNDGLNDFSNVIHTLEDRLSHFDNKEISERIEEKLDNTYNVVTASANSDKVMRQALMYMGEWIDNASENLENIYENSEKIEEVQEIIEELQEKMPEQKELIKSLEERFDEQQNRMDRLEMKLEKILSAIDDLDDNKLTKKVDKIEKQITKLSNNIEKLASYVDE